ALGGMTGGVIINLVVPQIFTYLNEYIFFVILILLYFIVKNPRKIKYFSGIIICLILILTTVYKSSYIIDIKRSFYGLIRAAEVEDTRVLYHGNILHGKEDLKNKGQPNSYYQPKMIASIFKSNPQKIAVVGLGVGVVLSYLKDPNVEVDVF